MKRVLAWILVLLLLAGCQKVPPAAEPAPPEPETPVEEPKTPEQETIAPQPEALEESTTMPEEEVNPAPVPEPEPVPEPDWCARAMEAYITVTDRVQFQVLVQKADGTATELTIVQGVNDWNVSGVESYFDHFDWSAADAKDWTAQTGVTLSLSVPGEISLSCRKGGEVAKLTTPEETIYLRAVKNAPETVFVSDLYNLLKHIPEDAYYDAVWDVTVDGSLAPQEAANALTEAVANGYLFTPDWVSWKPLDVRAVGAEVFDIYYGEPQQVCFALCLDIKVADPMAQEALAWQSGAGLGEPDAEGFCGWGRQVLIQKNENGDWGPTDWGTGGYSVNPQKPEEKPQLDWLVELFCLTEGYTHDHVAPYLILELPAEELARLPELLDQLTEMEGKALCRMLQQDLLDGHATFTQEYLSALLGDYGVYLNA